MSDTDDDPDIATEMIQKLQRRIAELEAERDEARACFYRASKRIEEFEAREKKLRLELDHSQRTVMNLCKELQNIRNPLITNDDQKIPPNSV